MRGEGRFAFLRQLGAVLAVPWARVVLASALAEGLFLIGPMGAGKSTIGRHLAELLGKDFRDSDQEIEKRTGAGIPLIFEIEGEAGFRNRESSVLDDLTRQSNLVLATGRIGSFRDFTCSRK